jgi:predicted enzyme related to lactoylglutathione lyase
MAIDNPLRIANVTVYVEDQRKAMKFWIEQVGFVLHRMEPMGQDASWIEVGPQDGKICLVLYPKSLMADWAQRKPSVTLDCDDIQISYHQMVAAGVKFIDPPKQMTWGWYASFVDTEGNWFGLRQSKKPAKADA